MGMGMCDTGMMGGMGCDTGMGMGMCDTGMMGGMGSMGGGMGCRTAGNMGASLVDEWWTAAQAHHDAMLACADPTCAHDEEERFQAETAALVWQMDTMAGGWPDCSW
jgi:hypothetical protein